MLDPLAVPAALAAGAATGLALVAAAQRPSPREAADWLRRRARPATGVRPVAPLAAGRHRWTPWLERLARRAGWRESPERVVAGALCASAALAFLGAGLGVWLQAPGVMVAAPLMGALGGPMLGYLALIRAVRRRRRLLLAELAPTLELLGLELSGGGSALAALSAVSMRTSGALAAELRQILVASQVAGSDPVDKRLDELGERLDLPPLRSLAALLGTSRAYGSGALLGVRALAADLRRTQRRELIAVSRRALNRVLIPSAVGVLLPFLAILLFPAVVTLMANFR